ncbi:helix-turn-helix domain-containing protein [soil metagenome]|jgi:hypothetical protein
MPSVPDQPLGSRSVQDAAGLNLDAAAVAALRGRLPELGSETVAAIRAEVPAYAGAFSGRLRDNIERGVTISLGSFLDVALGAPGASSSLAAALKGAHALGRGEARSGRTVEALHTAFRVGTRVAWSGLAEAAVAAGVSAADLARLGGVVFAYTDELSVASAAGHTSELAAAGRLRRQQLDELAGLLLSQAPAAELQGAAERAGWPPPRALAAVLVPAEHARAVLGLLDEQVLLVDEVIGGSPITVLFVADSDGPGRQRLAGILGGRAAVVGPARPWQQVATSFLRARRVWSMVAAGLLDPSDPTYTEDHLTALVLSADAEAFHDLRAAALAVLDELRPAARARLTDTLRSWLLHQGRREEIAAELFIHPQTVRYRVGQLRELFGDRLQQPAEVERLILALAVRRD